MADDVVLSQADIDALIKGSSGKNTPEKQSTSATVEKQPAPKIVAASRSQMEQLKTEKEFKPALSSPTPPQPQSKNTAKARSAPVARKPANQTPELAILQAAVKDLTRRLAKMEIALAEAQQGKNQNMNKMFHCDSCNSQGLVAFSTKCTKCGKQTWWGWWPQK